MKKKRSGPAAREADFDVTMMDGSSGQRDRSFFALLSAERSCRRYFYRYTPSPYSLTSFHFHYPCVTFYVLDFRSSRLPVSALTD